MCSEKKSILRPNPLRLQLLQLPQLDSVVEAVVVVAAVEGMSPCCFPVLLLQLSTAKS